MEEVFLCAVVSPLASGVWSGSLHQCAAQLVCLRSQDICLTSKRDTDAETKLNNSMTQGHISAQRYTVLPIINHIILPVHSLVCRFTDSLCCLSIRQKWRQSKKTRVMQWKCRICPVCGFAHYTAVVGQFENDEGFCYFEVLIRVMEGEALAALRRTSSLHEGPWEAGGV